MAPHGHSCEGEHHQHESPESGLKYSLYLKIDKDNLQCLNEAVEGSGKNVFKEWEERLNFNLFVESDADEELLFNIPFTGNVKLKSIIVIGNNDESHPSKMRLFKNRPHMTFDDVESTADQEFDLQTDPDGLIEYTTRMVIFNSVHHLSLHFPSNFGNDTTRINYIGLRGDFFEGHRHGVTICTYEARANLTDHKNPLEDNVTHQIQ